MIHRLHVEVHVPQAVVDVLGTDQAVLTFLRGAGVFPPEAKAMRWRQEYNRVGSLASYSLPVTQGTLAAWQAMVAAMPQ